MIKQMVAQVLTETPIGAVMGRTVRAAGVEAMVPSRLRALIGLPFVVAVTLPDGKVIKLHCTGPQDEVASAVQWHGFGGFEAETTSLFYRMAAVGDCIYDIGAHTGYYALLAAATNPSARIHAFEPAPGIHEQLLANIRLNDFDCIHCERAAADAHDGSIDLFVPDGPTPSSASTLAGFREADTRVSVPAVRLDTYAAKTGGRKVDLVKMDVEGTEHQVLAGMTGLLVEDRPIVVSEVLHNRNGPQQQAILERFGYRWFWITDDGPVAQDHITGDKEYSFRNYLYVHSERTDLIPEDVLAAMDL